MSLFSIKKLTYSYDKYHKDAKKALCDVSFSVEKGDFLAIIGKTGCGKSTLISHLNGLIKADEGTVLFDDKNIYDKTFDLSSLRFNCGVVFQYPDYQLFSDTVIEDVVFGPLKKGFSKEEATEKAMATLKLLGIEHLKDEVPFNLSGGEKRKVALAGVLSMEPEVLILDEPEAGLDNKSKNDIFKILERLNAEGKTIIFISHDLDDVMEYSKDALILENGKVVAFGKTYEVLTDIELIERCGLVPPNAVLIYNELCKKNIILDKTKLKFNELYNQIIEKVKC